LPCILISILFLSIKIKIYIIIKIVIYFLILTNVIIE